MRKKTILRILFLVIILLSTIFFIKWNSLLNRNIRYLEKKLSESAPQVSGISGDLFDLDYDGLYVFDPYQSKEEMEKQIGFETNILRQTVSEGMVNILFVKENSPIAYLYGYPSSIGYSVELTPGKYTKIALDSVQYNGSISDVGNSSGTPRIFMRYTFDM